MPFHHITLLINQGMRQDGAVSIVTRLKLDNLQFQSLQGQEIFFFYKMTSPALGFTQPPILWVLGFFTDSKEAMLEHLHQVQKGKNTSHHTPTPPMCLHGMYKATLQVTRHENAVISGSLLPQHGVSSENGGMAFNMEGGCEYIE